MAAPY